MKDLEKCLEAAQKAQQLISSEIDFLLFNSINSPLAHAHLLSAQIKAEEARSAIETLKANWLINEMLPERYVRDQLELAEAAIEAAEDHLKKAENAPWHSLRVTLVLVILGILVTAIYFA